jgi:hypothetical protein
MVTLESCHSRWIFDIEHHRYRRVLRGPEFEKRMVATEWRSFHELNIDQDSDSFVVLLNQEGTRMLRSWRHREDECPNCRTMTSQIRADEVISA